MNPVNEYIRQGCFAGLSFICLTLGCPVTAAAEVPPATDASVSAAMEVGPGGTQSALSYQLSGGSEEWDPVMRERIVMAMDAAVAMYNRHGSFPKAVTANYNPKTPTADANYNGWINFGGQIGKRVAMHEIGHTLGVGTHPNWRRMIHEGRWTGEHALRQLAEFDGPEAVLYADRQHFWPYGLNYDREGGEENKRRHVLMVAALRRDMGIAEAPVHAASTE
jgi:hypothetical protein